MARSRVVQDIAPLEEHEAVIAEYRERLSVPAEQGQHRWPPVIVGPAWQVGPGRRYVLPELTIGWDVLGWCGTNLQHGRDEPWRFTDEQARFILHWYALNEDGSFVYHDFTFQRLKGHGKDPLAATLMAVEMLGPCRFDGWDEAGEPLARDVPDAWVQTAAVSQEQTKNTMRLFPALFTPKAKREYGLQIGKEKIYALGDERMVEAVTSSPATLEGARSTFIVLNEPHHWTESNDGHEMAAVIARNAAKSPDGGARTGRITNAYEPGQDSVAERDREAYEKMAAGRTLFTGYLYDSLEAPPEAPLTAEAAPEVVRSIRGDSVWLNPERIVQEILDPRNPPSRSRRFWYNQITAAEDAWTTPQDWDSNRVEGLELLAGDQIVLFFDGSKSDDATGLVAARVSDGAVFVLGVWERPQGIEEWSVDREYVSGVVAETFAKYDPRAFFADPGAGEDETGARYWDAHIDRWSLEYGDRLDMWSVQGGADRHAVLWDMRSPARLKLFTEACERALQDIEAGQLPHDGHLTLRDHVRNARRRPNQYGVSVGKEHRESRRKIDLAVCAIGARMLHRMYLAFPDDRKRKDAPPSVYESRGLRRV
ncbi:MAG: phage terminase family protein [Dehalococcoidia bacterium]|nr:phage terminase family protein [Dehalococcoidia bacterium]